MRSSKLGFFATLLALCGLIDAPVVSAPLPFQSPAFKPGFSFLTAVSGASWTPANLAVPPLVWIDGADPSTVTSSGGTITVTNKGSTGGAVTASGTAAPTYSNKGFVFTSSNSQDLAMNATMLAGLPTGNVAHTLIAAVTPTALSGFKTIGGWGTASNQQQAFLGFSGAIPFFSHYSADQNGTSITVSTSLIMVATASPSAGVIYQNGTQASTGTFTTLNIKNNRGDIGGGQNGYLDGSEYEFLVLGYVPSTSDRQKIEGWIACQLNWQSSLPAGHPYQAACPTTTSLNSVSPWWLNAASPALVAINDNRYWRFVA